MIYRTAVDPDRERRLEEERELEAIAASAQRTRRRAIGGVGAAIVGAVLAVGALGGRIHDASARPAHCHRVSIRWENASHVPGPTWTACGD
jgi:hypothetical protein